MKVNRLIKNSETKQYFKKEKEKKQKKYKTR